MNTKHLFASSLAKFAATCATGLALAVLAPLSANAADVLLSGTIKSAAGEKMGGVTVSAKEEGKTITTQRLHRRIRRLRVSRRWQRQIPGVGAGASASRPPKTRSISAPSSTRT